MLVLGFGKHVGADDCLTDHGPVAFVVFAAQMKGSITIIRPLFTHAPSTSDMEIYRQSSASSR
jgi:hypothetical protein